MKTLEIASLLTEVHKILEKITSQRNEIERIESAVNGIISLENSFNGEGGQAIRSFFQDCHVPFLAYYKSSLDQYEITLINLMDALHSFEPSESGFISESFLEGDLDNGLQKAMNTTIELTNETNSIIQSVQDIVSIPFFRTTTLSNK
ncbi:hypothetical protein ELQ35_20570 [Peribacillus cavernae]|uniref:LXG domain-containing protein n=1 Tax=Peribacillus cavernae TaxID=1674310 RepID=A0A433HA96_9BACI|nr:putative ribonuclease toxin of YeeF-YezG toxin-antitoxin module [Peribacillus cavernae]RUQ25175.1 hypothetical protein ELQ35_20570 [Peribacillus cavernae]